MNAQFDQKVLPAHDVKLNDSNGFAWTPKSSFGDYVDKFAYEFEGADGFSFRASVRVTVQGILKPPPTETGSASEVYQAAARARERAVSGSER